MPSPSCKFERSVRYSPCQPCISRHPEADFNKYSIDPRTEGISRSTSLENPASRAGQVYAPTPPNGAARCTLS